MFVNPFVAHLSAHRTNTHTHTFIVLSKQDQVKLCHISSIHVESLGIISQELHSHTHVYLYKRQAQPINTTKEEEEEEEAEVIR